jgi:hypothetical protein
MYRTNQNERIAAPIILRPKHVLFVIGWKVDLSATDDPD